MKWLRVNMLSCPLGNGRRDKGALLFQQRGMWWAAVNASRVFVDPPRRHAPPPFHPRCREREANDSADKLDLDPPD
jgi:hypothetical protein